MTRSKLSYHDVVVTIGNDVYRIRDNYGLELTCCRAGGWQLWWHGIGTDKSKLLGGEYDGDRFRIDVAGKNICND